jgi:hypothetical protein
MYATLSLLLSSIFHLILTTPPAEIKSRKDSPSLRASLTANHDQAAASESILQAAGHASGMSHSAGLGAMGRDILECGEVLQMDWVNGAGGLLSGACFQVTNTYYFFHGYCYRTHCRSSRNLRLGVTDRKFSLVLGSLVNYPEINRDLTGT